MPEENKANVMRHVYRQLSDAEKLNIEEIKDRGLAFWLFLDMLGVVSQFEFSKG